MIVLCLLTDTCGTGRRSPHTAHTLRDERGQTHHSEDSGAPPGWPAGGEEGEERGSGGRVRRESGRVIFGAHSLTTHLLLPHTTHLLLPHTTHILPTTHPLLPHTTHLLPTTHLHVGVELCKLQHNIAGSDGQRKLKLDLSLARGECFALSLQPNAPLVLKLNGVLHRPVTVVQVDYTDLHTKGGGGGKWRER